VIFIRSDDQDNDRRYCRKAYLISLAQSDHEQRTDDQQTSQPDSREREKHEVGQAQNEARARGK
jgi:hypothetical protein